MILSRAWILFFSIWVTASMGSLWTWRSGTSESNMEGNYSSLSGGYPGAREGMGMSGEGDGIYLFGGTGIGYKKHIFGILADLWLYNTSRNQWEWLSGPSSLNHMGLFAAPRLQAHADNSPASRYNFYLAISRGLFFVFGGNNAERTPMNDLWRYEIVTGLWTWMSGKSSNWREGNYGVKGQGNSQTTPGARRAGAMCTSQGVLYLYGGYGFDHTPTPPVKSLGDLWKYSIDAEQWTWLSGVSKGSENAVYNHILGEFTATAFPGGRTQHSLNFIGENMFLFGGIQSEAAQRNDLWEYSMTRGQWTWVAGMSGIYREEGVGKKLDPAPGDHPRNRGEHIVFALGEELMVYGGMGELPTRDQYIPWNDMWSFHIRKRFWTWVGGTRQIRMRATYHSIGERNPENWPGSRVSSGGAMTDHGMFLFGGRYTDGGYLSDLWSWEEVCPSGEGLLNDSTLDCGLCARGKYALHGACVLCASGTSSSVAGANECDLCSAGKYMERTGASNCLNCGFGQYASGDGSSECLWCTAGRVARNLGLTACADCAVGKGSNFNFTQCDYCIPGTFLNGTCAECPYGKISRSVSATTCQYCDDGMFYESKNSCSECISAIAQDSKGYIWPKREESISLTYCKKVACAVGYYGKPYAGQRCTMCLDMPGVSCPKNSSLPVIAPGYFRSENNPSIAYECSPPDSCAFTNEDESTTCSEGYAGLNCGECAPGTHYKYGDQCLECSWLAVLNFAGLFFLILVSLFLLLLFAVPTNKIFAISVSVFWLQILDLVTSVRDDWPPLINWLFVFSSSMNFNIDLLSAECSFHVAYWPKWHAKMVSPLVLGAMQLIFFVIQEWNIHKFSLFDLDYTEIVKRIGYKLAQVERNTDVKVSEAPVIEENDFHSFQTKNIDYDELYPFRRSRFVYSFGNLLNSLYVLLSSTLLEIFLCTPQSDGTHWMKAASNQQCFTLYWYQILITAVVFMLYILALPVALARFLKSQRINRNDEFMCNNFGSFIIPYQNDKYLWPVFDILFRFLCVVLTRLVAFYSTTAGLAGVIVVIAAYDVLLLREKPYVLRLNMILSLLYVVPGSVVTCRWSLLVVLCIICTMVFDASIIGGTTAAALALVAFLAVAATAVISIYMEKVYQREEQGKQQ